MRLCPLLLIAACLALWACSEKNEKSEPEAIGLPIAQSAVYVGRARCATCHTEEAAAYANSHHDLALQSVIPDTVLGAFDGSTLEHDGVTWTFRREGDDFLVETNESGSTIGHRVAKVFGVAPLQQYLVEFPGGRMQTLPTAWDSRPTEEGGQRWYHIYPDEHIPIGDELHWQGINQTWNSMCAECHSTDLVRGWNAEDSAFHTTWVEEDVSCEACHGPGSLHAQWAEAGGIEDAPPGLFLVAGLGDKDDGKWVTQAETGLPVRIPARSASAELDTCAKCHSRRRALTDGHAPGEPFLNGYEPSLLLAGLYHNDGQILDEVYVWGSFVQSRMHAAGVSCRDCHDPHSNQLVAQGNALCTQCHDSGTFDRETHYHHAAGTPGSSCVDCHMASRDYMVIDGRRDHSFRVPRPDLASVLMAPDACSACHAEGSSWAAEQIAEWAGEKTLPPHPGEILARVRAGELEALDELEGLIQDKSASDIMRATALFELGLRLEPPHMGTLIEAAHDSSALVRAAAARATESMPPESRAPLIGHLLDDDVRAVRVSAARSLASAPLTSLDPSLHAAHGRAVQEARNAELANGERPGSWLNLGVLEADLGHFEQAEQATRRAWKMDPDLAAAGVNLADILRMQGREEESREVLIKALERHPNNPSLHHALGLAWVRADNPEHAVEHLGKAAAWDPSDPRLALVHGLCLSQLERHGEAIFALENALQMAPTNGDLRLALIDSLRAQERWDEALTHGQELLRQRPEDARVVQLLREIQQNADR
ncbi:MAG: tetratricopeptide repeat protein [bacterium]